MLKELFWGNEVTGTLKIPGDNFIDVDWEIINSRPPSQTCVVLLRQRCNEQALLILLLHSMWVFQ